MHSIVVVMKKVRIVYRYCTACMFLLAVYRTYNKKCDEKKTSTNHHARNDCARLVFFIYLISTYSRKYITNII